MKIFGIHIFHRWKEEIDWRKDRQVQGGKYAAHIYRHCIECGKWQEHHANYGDSWWKDTKNRETI